MTFIIRLPEKIARIGVKVEVRPKIRVEPKTKVKFKIKAEFRLLISSPAMLESINLDYIDFDKTKLNAEFVRIIFLCNFVGLTNLFLNNLAILFVIKCNKA